MVKKYILSVFLLFLSISVYSQLKLKAAVTFSYSYGIPSGDFHSYIPGKAFDGGDFHYRHFVHRNVSLGFRTGWNSVKKELPRDVYDTDKGTVSAVQTRYFHTLPLLLTGYYYLRSSHHVMPYIGGGIGAYFSRYEKWFGVVQTRKNSINFGLSPEVGIVVPFKNTGIGLILNGKFNNVFYSHNELNNLRYFEAGVGVYIGYPGFEDPSYLK